MSDQNDSIFQYHDLIAAIVAAIEARDPNTAQHSVRVSNMVEEICLLMNISKGKTQLIHVAADLHDIGKIGIVDSILKKQGCLDNDEWKKMKDHTIVGFDILSKVERFGEIANIVRHHHERWDGKGYPDGISENNIPLGARIIAIADSIDAMLSNRSYRKGMSSEQCKIEIQKNRGKMYDVLIADLVVDNWESVLVKRQLEV